jgi:hypothetical protein
MMDNGNSNPGFIESIKSRSDFKMFPTPEQIQSVSELLLMTTTMLATASSRTLGYHGRMHHIVPIGPSLFRSHATLGSGYMRLTKANNMHHKNTSHHEAKPPPNLIHPSLIPHSLSKFT